VELLDIYFRTLAFEEMSHFYLTLPSNSSMLCHPNNTAATFTTALPNAIELNGEWEAALAEITYPRTFCNVADDECYVEVWEWAEGFMLTLPKGYYASVTEVISALTKQTGYDDKIFHLKYDSTTLKTIMEVAPRKIVEMSPALAHILGFAKCKFTNSTRYELRYPISDEA